MKRLDCDPKFGGGICDSSPECYSPDTEEAVDKKDDGHWR